MSESWTTWKVKIKITINLKSLAKKLSKSFGCNSLCKKRHTSEVMEKVVNKSLVIRIDHYKMIEILIRGDVLQILMNFSSGIQSELLCLLLNVVFLKSDTFDISPSYSWSSKWLMCPFLMFTRFRFVQSILPYDTNPVNYFLLWTSLHGYQFSTRYCLKTIRQTVLKFVVVK